MPEIQTGPTQFPQPCRVSRRQRSKAEIPRALCKASAWHGSLGGFAATSTNANLSRPSGSTLTSTTQVRRHFWAPSASAGKLSDKAVELRSLMKADPGVTSDEAGLGAVPRITVEFDNDRLDKCPSSRVALCPYPTICRQRVARSSAGGQVARRLPGRHSSVTASPLRSRTALLVGRRGSGRPPPWCPQGGLCARRHEAGHVSEQTAWGLQRHYGGIGGRGLFAPQLTYPGSSWEQGSHLPYTPTGRLR